MKYYNNILEAVGKTPLVKLNRVVEGLKPLVLAKMEVFNPGGSVKDRPALKMIEAAEKAGLLKDGGTIIEPTSGNTGTGLAQIAAVKGYRCILVVPDKVAKERINLLKAYGAEVVVVPTLVSASSHESYYSVANRLTTEISGAFQPNQFTNPNNPLSHYLSTGPEIWEATDGRITHFLASVGTGGTISGTGHYLKEQNPRIKVIGIDPEGSIYSGDVAQPYKVEGIGEDFIPSTVDLKIIDEFVRVSDKESFLMARCLARTEGLLVGGSAGATVAGALRIAIRLKRSDVMVVLLPDGGRGYLSKMYSDDWMQASGFLPAPGLSYYTSDLLARKQHENKLPLMLSVAPEDSIQTAISIMQTYGIDQLPVLANGEKAVGHINDLIAMQVVYENKDPCQILVKEVMAHPCPQFDLKVEIDEIYRVFRLGHSMVVITQEGKSYGVLTKSDIMSHLRETTESRGSENLSLTGEDKVSLGVKP